MRYLIGLAAAAVGGTLLFRRFRASRSRSFDFEGAHYVRHPDGSFTSAEGAPVISPQLEAVRDHWEKSAR